MNGLGFTAGYGLHEVSHRMPLGFDFFGGYVLQSDPGNAVEARKIFINDATGGNEAFKVYSNAWGFGIGFKTFVNLGEHFLLGLETTAEYFFNTQLKGHGFFYNANNSDDNPRNNYRYGDADAAINQPLFYPRVQLILAYKL